MVQTVTAAGYTAALCPVMLNTSSCQGYRLVKTLFKCCLVQLTSVSES